MATIKGYKIKVMGNKEAEYLTEAQGKIVEAQLETGTRFIKLPGKVIKSSSIAFLEEVKADESCFPVPTPTRAHSSKPVQAIRTRIFVDGEETDKPSRMLESSGTSYTIERTEVLSSRIMAGEDGRTRTVYEYGEVVDRAEVYYIGTDPILKKV